MKMSSRKTAGFDFFKGRIAIVHPEANLDSIPCLFNTIILLAEHGYAVDVFTSQNWNHVPPKFEHPAVHVHFSRFGFFLSTFADPQNPVRKKAQSLGCVFTLILKIYRFLRGASTWLREAFFTLTDAFKLFRLHRALPYRCVIGVDPRGLRKAAAMNALVRAPLAYYSLELLLSYELSDPKDLRMKERERSLSRKTAFIIIQDEERARMMAKDNGLPMDRFILVPNGPLGPARRAPSRYWHRRFNLPDRARVLLHSGSLGEWTGLKQCILGIAQWPEEWVLVIHTRYDAEAVQGADRLLASAPPGRVFLSTKPVPRDEYDGLVDGADIGIAFYFPMEGYPMAQDNIRTIGLSSGKISYCLRAGAPVIVNSGVSFSGLVEEDGCGVAVDSPMEIGGAIRKIEKSYEEFSRRALMTFERRLDFAGSFDNVLEKIDALN